MNAVAKRRTASSLALMLFAVFVLLNITCVSFSQTTVGTGSIVGIASDPSGGVITGAKVTITNAATGQVIELTTNAL